MPVAVFGRRSATRSTCEWPLARPPDTQRTPSGHDRTLKDRADMAQRANTSGFERIDRDVRGHYLTVRRVTRAASPDARCDTGYGRERTRWVRAPTEVACSAAGGVSWKECSVNYHRPKAVACVYPARGDAIGRLTAAHSFLLMFTAAF
jgi:hypothetical protein